MNDCIFLMKEAKAKTGCKPKIEMEYVDNDTITFKMTWLQPTGEIRTLARTITVDEIEHGECDVAYFNLKAMVYGL